MTLLSIENVSKSHRHEALFEGATFSLADNDRVGLIGNNGSGKSSLLRIIVGLDHPDSGRVMLAGNPVVGYLPQNPALESGRTVLDSIFSGTTPGMKLLAQYEQACHDMAAGDEAAIHRSAEIAARMEATGAWELETNARTVLSQLGIDDVDARVEELSGGQRKRVGLAHSLIERPDLLILDEPTNHLDAETIEWLEGYLTRWRGALLLVTHDRYFLDRVTSRIVELDERRLWSYLGSYGYYLEKKEEETERRGVEERKRAALIRQERAWLLKGAKARTTKQKARIERAEELISRPKDAPRAALQLDTASRRLGNRVLELHGVTKAYDGRVLVGDFTYIVPPGERLGIIGPNGSGKTTLLEMIAGRVAPDSGRVEIGQTVVVGYFDQESTLPNEDQRVIDVIRDVAEHVFTGDGRTITAAQMLERFLFTGAMQHSPVARLSGGERRRLCLLRVLMAAPNLLLLDEPTNDLDISTLIALEDYLDAFNGSVIVASHDRYFLDRTAAHLLRMEGDGRIREYPGSYSTFLEIRERERAAETPLPRGSGERSMPAAKQQENDEADVKARLSFKERKELSSLEEEIAALESRKSAIEIELGVPTTEFRHATTLSDELREVESELSRAIDRWAELADRA